MSKNKGRQQENAMLASAQASSAAAAAESATERRIREPAEELDDWEMGKKGPVDVRNMPGSNVAMSLFQNAKQSRDAGRMGRGLAYGENSNGSFAKAIDSEMQLERDVNASGHLEDYVTDKLAAKDQALYGVAAMGNARRAGGANRDMQLYSSFLGRPKETPAWKQFLLGAMSNGGQAASMMAV